MSRLRSAVAAVALVSGALVPLTWLATVAPAWADNSFNVRPVPGTMVLNDVACPTTAFCVAVGQLDDASGSHGVVVPITNGVPGAPQVVAGTTGLIGIACYGPTTCVAVGRGLSPTGGSSAVVVPIVNGVAGAAQVVALTTSALNDVACYSATSCVAVGGPQANQSIVVPITNGVPGPRQLIPNVRFGLLGVACYGPTVCAAVGRTRNPANIFENLGVQVLISNGTAGIAQIIAGTSGLSGIGCGVSICEATGTASSNQQPVVV